MIPRRAWSAAFLWTAGRGRGYQWFVRRVFLVFMLAAFCGRLNADWKPALPGWRYAFPADHGNHPGFKTEWWYFTGNLHSSDGKDFGYQLTFFRQGVREPGAPAATSRFVVSDVKFAHFAVAEISGGKFHHFQRLARGAFGEAGFDEGKRLAWIRDWTCERTGDNGFRLAAKEEGIAVELDLASARPPIVHGRNGVSQKAEGEGRASHYYSLTRLETTGRVTIDGKVHDVSGTSWFDHEWASNQLAAHQKGWDWFSLQLNDGTELMLFQIRTDDDKQDPHSAGTFVFEDGSDLQIGQAGFSLEPTAWWRSETTGANYPVEWRLSVRAIDLELEIKPRLRRQELDAKPFTYWEGAVEAAGTRNSKPVEAVGYLEMTGYAGNIVGLKGAKE
ncbi:MAG: carotenoid 1,2-hydratase [Verrucomicrobia bacterium]|nr:carotenoid 1,2-hydratase [Verrucomicrobiota bacterium]